MCDGWRDAGLVKFKIFEVRLELTTEKVVEAYMWKKLDMIIVACRVFLLDCKDEILTF